jgi:hypothetical protein
MGEVSIPADIIAEGSIQAVVLAVVIPAEDIITVAVPVILK